jgi:ABC-2 type transport system permease protein
MSSFVGAFRFQLQVIRSEPDYLLPLLLSGLYAVVFLTVVRHVGRSDLTANAVVAPVLMGLWGLSLGISGEIVDVERWNGTLELTIAAPAGLAFVVLARTLAVTVLGLVVFAEIWLLARVGFGVEVVVRHPLAFALTLLATALAMAGTALTMAALFVLTRSARTFQNSLSFPFYVLGGVIAPVSLLPGWLRPVSAAVFLSWSADLFRASLASDPVTRLPLRLAVLLALAALGFLAGRIALGRIVRRVRGDGTVGSA